MHQQYQSQDKFAHLKAIASGQVKSTQNTNARYWDYERDGDFMGTILKFDNFEVPPQGMQYTLLAESPDGELISVFTNDWVRESLRRKCAEVGDLVLIQCFGIQQGERFKRYNVEIQKI